MSLPKRLNTRESAHFLLHLDHLTQAELPLADGLRAAAGDSMSHRLSRCLCEVAQRLDRGEPFEAVFVHLQRTFPAPYRHLAAAAEQTDSLRTVVSQLVTQRIALGRVWSRFLSSLAYPLVLCCLLLLLLGIMKTFLGPDRLDYFEWQYDLMPFDYRLTRLLKWSYDYGSSTMAWGIGCAAGLYLLWRLALPTRWRCRWRTKFPLVGTIFHHLALADASYTLSILVKHRLPLPRALRITADRTSDAAMAETCRQLATNVERGGRFSDAVSAHSFVPAFAKSLLAQGESEQALSESLQTVAELSRSSAEQRERLLRSTLPPLTLLVIAVFVAVLFIGLLAPGLDVIQLLGG